MEEERYGMIRLFETFVSSLARLLEQDSILFSLQRNRLAVCHRLAYYIEQTLSKSDCPKECVDLCVYQPKAFGKIVPDILIHNRSEKDPRRPLAVVIREGYLSTEELIALHYLKVQANCALVLAVAFLSGKNYILIYRANGSHIYYYHFNKEDYHCQLLKSRQINEIPGDMRQLKLISMKTTS